MNTTEAIITIHSHRIDNLALTLSCKSWTTLNDHINVGHFFDADKLIKAEASFLDLVLVVLVNSSRVDLFTCWHSKFVDFLIFLLLRLEFRHNEGELSKLWLSLFFDRCSHTLKDSRLM